MKKKNEERREKEQSNVRSKEEGDGKEGARGREGEGEGGERPPDGLAQGGGHMCRRQDP